MITDHLMTLLTAAGCGQVVYESTQLANVLADTAQQGVTLGIVLEPDTLTLTTKGNGVVEKYPPTVVELLKQVKPEDTAENNKAVLDELLTLAKQFIYRIIKSGVYAKVGDVTATKVNESRYDANVIGWALQLNLTPLTNQLNC